MSFSSVESSKYLASLIGGRIRKGYGYQFGGWLEVNHRSIGKIAVVFMKECGKTFIYFAPPLKKTSIQFCNPAWGTIIEEVRANKDFLLIKLVDDQGQKVRWLIISLKSNWAISVVDSSLRPLWSSTNSKINIEPDKIELVPPKNISPETLEFGLKSFNETRNKFLLEIAKKKIKSKMQKIQSAIKNVRCDYERFVKDISNTRIADAIMANLNNIPKNAHSTRITDPYTNNEISVDFPAGISPAQFANELYSKSKKAKRGKIKSVARYRELLKEQRQLKQFLYTLNIDNISDILAHLKLSPSEILNELSPGISHTHKNKNVCLPSRIRRYISSDGFEILVGKCAESNRMLTFSIAKPDDYWFHAEGVSGAHVIVRMAGKKQIPGRTLMESAQIAGFFSDAKHSTLVPVIYTLRRYVHQVRKNAGKVRLDRMKTIIVSPKIPQIERKE